MFYDNEARGWHLWGPFLTMIGTYGYLRNFPSDTIFLASWVDKGFFFTTCFLIASWGWRINTEIVIRKNQEGRVDEPQKVIVQPEPEPELPDGMTAVTRVNGIIKPSMNYNYLSVKSLKIDKARQIAAKLVSDHHRGRAFDLTEETWARNRGDKKKFVSRRELNKIKAEWEAQGMICRLSAATNAPHDALDWDRIERYARGLPLPKL